MDYNEMSLKLHEENHGKLEVVSKIVVKTRDDLSTAYTPGVAEPCRKIRDNKEEDGRYYYPRARFMADRNSGVVILHDLIDKNDYENENDYIVESVEILINNFFEMGIPKSIYVRDEETKMFLKDIADKAKIKIIVSPKLKAIDKFYDSLGRMGM